jgi:hypothetical protein
VGKENKGNKFETFKAPLTTEWEEAYNFGEGQVSTKFAKGGWDGFFGKRKTIISGDDRKIEIVVSRGNGYLDQPEEIIVMPNDRNDMAFRFSFVQTDRDRMNANLPPYFSIVSPRGNLLQRGSGDYHDYSLAAKLLGSGLEKEMEKAGVYISSKAYSYGDKLIHEIVNI